MNFSKDILNEQCMGNPDLMDEVIQSFVELIPRQLDELQNAVNQNDIEASQKQLHKIKGAIGMLCQPAFYHEVNNLEKRLKFGKTEHFRTETYMALASLRELILEVKMYQMENSFSK